MGNSHSGELVSSIAALRTTPVPEGAPSEAYWLQVFPATAFSPTDLFSVLSPEAVREMRDVQPRNLALAVRKVRWCNVVSSFAVLLHNSCRRPLR